MDDKLKAFDALLDKTVRAPRLSGSKVTELKEMSTKLVAYDHHIVTSLLRLNTSLPPASAMRISNLYVFDAIARAAKSDIQKGIGRTVSNERGKGTQAGLLSKMEGVVDSVVEGMVDDGKGGVWAEGRDKTRKIIEIWRKSNTFPEDCIKQLTARIGSSSTPAGMSPAGRSPRGNSKPARSTTPTVPPPLHVIERYGVAAAAALAPAAHVASSSSKSPTPPQAPAHLPPEIMALLGVKSPGETSATKPPMAGGSSLDAVLANVRNPVVPNAPAPTPNLDPAQLAALANIAALTGGAGAGPSQPPSHPIPPRPNGAGGDYNGARYGERERARSRSPDWRRNDNDRRDFRDGRDSRDSRDFRPRDDPRDYPPPRRDYPQDHRQDYRQGRDDHRDSLPPHQQRDPRRDARGSRDFDRERDGLPPRPDVGLPPRPAPGPPPGVRPPVPPTMARPPPPPSAAGRAPPGPPVGARSPPPRDAGWGSAPTMRGGQSGGSGGSASAGGLASFDLASFNPTSAESWAALGAAWKTTTGRDPNQIELMGFLATGQVPDANGGGMGAMGMGGMQGMGMGGDMGGMGMH